jgi:hypothetical protein
MDTETTIETIEIEDTQLTANDRCDQCGAQAFVQVFFESGYLLFCAHHYNEHEKSLEEIAVYTIDCRDQLEPNRLKE